MVFALKQMKRMIKIPDKSEIFKSKSAENFKLSNIDGDGNVRDKPFFREKENANLPSSNSDMRSTVDLFESEGGKKDNNLFETNQKEDTKTDLFETEQEKETDAEEKKTRDEI